MWIWPHFSQDSGVELFIRCYFIKAVTFIKLIVACCCLCVLCSVLRQWLGIRYFYRLSMSLSAHKVKYFTPAVPPPCFCTCTGQAPSLCSRLCISAEAAPEECKSAEVASEEAGYSHQLFWLSIILVFLYHELHVTQLAFQVWGWQWQWTEDLPFFTGLGRHISSFYAPTLQWGSLSNVVIRPSSPMLIAHKRCILRLWLL